MSSLLAMTILIRVMISQAFGGIPAAPEDKLLDGGKIEEEDVVSAGLVEGSMVIMDIILVFEGPGGEHSLSRFLEATCRLEVIPGVVEFVGVKFSSG